MAFELNIDQGQHLASRMVQPRSYDQQAHLVEQTTARKAGSPVRRVIDQLAKAQLPDRIHLHLSQAWPRH